MNRNPYVVGYWARVNNLTPTEVMSDEAFGTGDYEPAECAAFQDGWATADEELRAERLRELKRDLRAVDDEYDADAATTEERRR